MGAVRCVRSTRQDLKINFTSNTEFLVHQASFEDTHGFSGWALNINRLGEVTGGSLPEVRIMHIRPWFFMSPRLYFATYSTLR